MRILLLMIIAMMFSCSRGYDTFLPLDEEVTITDINGNWELISYREFGEYPDSITSKITNYMWDDRIYKTYSSWEYDTIFNDSTIKYTMTHKDLRAIEIGSGYIKNIKFVDDNFNFIVSESSVITFPNDTCFDLSDPIDIFNKDLTTYDYFIQSNNKIMMSYTYTHYENEQLAKDITYVYIFERSKKWK